MFSLCRARTGRQADGEGGSGVPVRAGPDPRSGADAAVACGRGAVRVELGLGQSQERHAAEGKWHSAAELHKMWNAEKKADPGLAWWSEHSKCAYQEAFRNLDRALRDYVKSRKGERKGRRSGSRSSRSAGSAGTPSGSPASCAASLRPWRFPGSGRSARTSRCSSSPQDRRQHGAHLVGDGVGRLSGGSCRSLSRWSGTRRAARQARHGGRGRPRGQDAADRGGQPGAADRDLRPKSLRAGLRRLRRTSRAHARKQPGSAGRRKSAARLARIHARIANVRADALHKATTALSARYETVVVEDLNVTGMIANRRLARAVSDQGFGAARRMLGYKTAREGGTLLVAGRWYPSSKKCSGCGSVKAKLTLAERVYQCDTCGLVMGRDVNAARNLVSLAASGADTLNACGAAVRPGLAAGRAAVKQEPGAANAGQTGTAAIEAAAA